MELGFEYNDEINYRPDAAGGSPLKVFSDEGMANTYCEHMNIKSMRSAISGHGGIASYFYSVEDIDKTGKLEGILQSLKVATDGNDSTPELSDADVKRILDNSNLRFFTVESVELGKPDDVYDAMLEDKTV